MSNEFQLMCSLCTKVARWQISSSSSPVFTVCSWCRPQALCELQRHSAESIRTIDLRSFEGWGLGIDAKAAKQHFLSFWRQQERAEDVFLCTSGVWNCLSEKFRAHCEDGPPQLVAEIVKRCFAYGLDIEKSAQRAAAERLNELLKEEVRKYYEALPEQGESSGDMKEEWESRQLRSSFH